MWPGAGAVASASTWRSAGRRRACLVARSPTRATTKSRMRSAIKVLVGDRPVFTADGGITYAKFGSDGSLAVVVDGEKLERWDGSSLTTTKIPPGLPGHHSDSSCRQLCRALAHPPGRPAHRPRLQAGTDQPLVRGDTAAWSPGRDLGRRPRTASRSSSTVLSEARLDITWPAAAAADGLASEPLGRFRKPRPAKAGRFGSDADARPSPSPCSRRSRPRLAAVAEAMSTSMAPPLQSRSRAAAAASPAASSTRRSRHQTSPSPTSRARR